MEFYKKKDFAQIYLQYRPNYPSEIYDKILGYLDEGLSTEEKLRKVAVDVGCGSGQNTRALAKYFDKVIGIDSSDAQLEEARKSSSNYSNISFISGSATDLSAILKDHHCDSVDLITVAAALHWFDVQPFYEECLNVLKTGGVFAGYCYRTPRLENPKADQVISQLIKQTLKDYWPPFTKHLRNRYQDLYSDLSKVFQQTSRDDFEVSVNLPLSSISGFVKSFACYHKYIEINPNAADPIEESISKLKTIISASSEETAVKSYINYYIILGKKL